MSENSASHRSFWAVALATVTGNLYLLLGTLLFASLAVVVAWVPPRGDWTYRVARLWGRGVLLTSGVKVKSCFDAPLDPTRQYVFMANHRSLFDIPALLVSLPGQTRFMAKKGLFQIPIFGWALRAGGFINIDRSDLSSARGSFTQAISRLRAGTSVLVFPEGTRSSHEQMLKFRRGGFLLALKSGLPVVPVGIVGSREVQSKKEFIIRPGAVVMRYGEAIESDEFSVSKKDDLMRAVRERISELILQDRDKRPDEVSG